MCKVCDRYTVHEDDDRKCLNTGCPSNIVGHPDNPAS